MEQHGSSNREKSCAEVYFDKVIFEGREGNDKFLLLYNIYAHVI